MDSIADSELLLCFYPYDGGEQGMSPHLLPSLSLSPAPSPALSLSGGSRFSFCPAAAHLCSTLSLEDTSP